MTDKAITHVETVTRAFDDAHTDNEHFVFCAFIENGRRYVDRMVWRGKQLHSPRGAEYTDNGFAIAIYIEDPEKPNRGLADFGVEDTDEIPRAPYLGKAPTHAIQDIEDGLIRRIAARLNPGCIELIDDVMAHHRYKQAGQAGGEQSLTLLKRIRRRLDETGRPFDVPTMASLGDRSAIHYTAFPQQDQEITDEHDAG